ncbi:hypothetical protein CTheo_4401 [Ceratobasidium theobromae]|uniref:Prokaryotic-type class I peptide chain release factors domain-containing protein n=1 Tax=Ceratobasidium theobromae TaxID=1582974 RepID=A0A5N5QLU0_9AGAM|nr:hypothetical protein CTheo_4401 [Ceratobasidium theobromae]
MPLVLKNSNGLLIQIRRVTIAPHFLPLSRVLKTRLQKEDTKNLARSWVREFSERGGVPKREFEVGYSRSSGPGGQHVNKTSTKANVRLPLDCRWIPAWAKRDLRAHPTYYVVRTDSLQVSSDVHRSQSQNLAECLRKINFQIEMTASNAIPKPPDIKKMKRIENHEAKFERTKKLAKQHVVGALLFSRISSRYAIRYSQKAIKRGRGKVRPE